MKTKLYRMTEADYATVQEAAANFAQTFPVESDPRADIYAALRRFKESCPRVKIEVLGGVAEVTQCSPGVIVTIKDHDNDECGD